MSDYQEGMLLAIEQAKQVIGKTHPNPAVGCVILHQGEVVAKGATQAAGCSHAEVVALNAFAELGIQPDASTTLYVTLEPCSTTGKTPPCTDAIKASGIKKVVVGAIDPNPKHQGNGLGLLKECGIEVVSGVEEDSCEDLNLIFNHWIKSKQPFIAAKIATTLDGRIATRGGLSKWITSATSRQDVMRWRRAFPAIGVGAGTALSDDPRLTARIEGEEEWCPIRFVFDRNLITLKNEALALYADEYADRTVVLTSEANRDRIEAVSKGKPYSYWLLKEHNGDKGLESFLSQCSEKEISGVYLEGGSQLLSGFLAAKRLDYLFCYRAPKLLGDTQAISPFTGLSPHSIDDAIRLKSVKHKLLGEDQLIRGIVSY